MREERRMQGEKKWKWMRDKRKRRGKKGETNENWERKLKWMKNESRGRVKNGETKNGKSRQT